MDVDQSIAQVAAKLDEWYEGNAAVFASQNLTAQIKAMLEGVQIDTELERLKAQGLSAMRALLDRGNESSDDSRIASLLQGFVFGAKLANTLNDELSDTDGETKVVRLMYEMVGRLDSSSHGRLALAVLLDHPDAGVRAFAGAYLIELMPERVIPILRDIEQQEDANSAHFKAAFTLFRFEKERQQPGAKA